MKIIPTCLDDLKIIEPSVFKDPRGFFMETYRQNNYQDACPNCIFVQDNLSFSQKGTLRGMHFQVQFLAEGFECTLHLRRPNQRDGRTV